MENDVKYLDENKLSEVVDNAIENISTKDMYDSKEYFEAIVVKAMQIVSEKVGNLSVEIEDDAEYIVRKILINDRILVF